MIAKDIKIENNFLSQKEFDEIQELLLTFAKGL
jgi:hypothetical protein